jgi:STE24 endopeptidase
MSEPTISYGEELGRDVPPSEGDWQRAAREFGRARLRLYAAQTAVGLLFPFLFWYLGWAAGLEKGITSLVSQRWLLVLLFLLAYQAISALLFLPFSWYGGFRLQHRFGLSRQRLPGWVADWARSTLLGSFFFLVGMESFYLLIDALPGAWWWILATGLGLMALLLTFVAPVLLLPIFYKASPLEDRDLADRIERLADRAGAHVSKVCTIDMSRRTVAANAALTGIGRTRQLLLGDTMLRQFTPDEVETVVAHELGHHVHGDIWKGVLMEVAGIWVGLFLLQWLVRPAFLLGGLGDISLLRNFPLLALLGEAASLAVMPVANAISRRHEAQADAFAARLSRNPRAYSDALYRLARQNLSELWPPRWVELLFYTHPAIGRRMARVAEAGAGRETG